MDVLKAHWKPKPVIIVERFHFHQRTQQEGEDVASFMAALRRLADKCAFGTHLEEALRDRLVCGLRSTDTQRKLLTKDGLFNWIKTLCTSKGHTFSYNSYYWCIQNIYTNINLLKRYLKQ